MPRAYTKFDYHHPAPPKVYFYLINGQVCEVGGGKGSCIEAHYGSHLRVTIGYIRRATVGHLMATAGHFRVTIGCYFSATVGQLRVGIRQ